ncbi:MAG: alpha/beta hydrolase [Verrucomicrobiales bacterium]|nr:alpha/beta hydrolase [Verrucomicrobiales bacterium]
MKPILIAITLLSLPGIGPAAPEMTNEPIWPDLAPGETESNPGEAMPLREGEDPPIIRLVNIRKPTVDILLPPAGKANGTAVVILPGGGFGKVVPDKEGYEAAPWLHEMGIAVFSLRYRTREGKPEDEPLWKRPLQDAQRTIRMIRANAGKWNLDPERIGILAFSAGGQIGAVLHAADDEAAYDPIDKIDEHPCHTDFAMLIYPWNVMDSGTETLIPGIQFHEKSRPAFIVHTHDDRSSSLGSVLIYADLKRNKVPAELHIYENGGHGYGVRPVPDSNIDSWRARAGDWLKLRGLGK